MKKIVITEDEKNDILSKYDNIDIKLLHFLLKTYRTKIMNFDNFKVTEVRFEGFPGYGFNSMRSKKEIINKIMDFLFENDIVEYDDSFYQKSKGVNEKRQIIVKTIKKFINLAVPGIK